MKLSKQILANQKDNLDIIQNSIMAFYFEWWIAVVLYLASENMHKEFRAIPVSLQWAKDVLVG